MRSPRELFRSITEIRERESDRLFMMAGYLMLIITCYTITKAVRDSLFIVAVGPSQLPYLYILSALCMGVVSAIYPHALRRIGLYSVIRLTSLIAISNLLAFWWLTERPGVLWFYVLYVWVSLFGAITASGPGLSPLTFLMPERRVDPLRGSDLVGWWEGLSEAG